MTSAPPPEVRVQAAAGDLGHSLAVFRLARQPRALVGWSLLILFPLNLLRGPDPWAVLVFGAVCWPPAARGLLRSPLFGGRMARRRIHLYERGFVYVDGSGGVDLYAWEQIATIFRRETVLRIAEKATIRHRLTVTRTDGRSIRLTAAWEGSGRMAQEITARVTRVQVARAREALAKGRGVGFGRLVLNADGIIGPRGFMSSSKAEIVTTPRGRFIIFNLEEFLPHFSARARRMPNYPALVALCRSFTSTQIS